jgi:hypothetical protein
MRPQIGWKKIAAPKDSWRLVAQSRCYSMPPRRTSFAISTNERWGNEPERSRYAAVVAGWSARPDPLAERWSPANRRCQSTAAPRRSPWTRASNSWIRTWRTRLPTSVVISSNALNATLALSPSPSSSIRLSASVSAVISRALAESSPAATSAAHPRSAVLAFPNVFASAQERGLEPLSGRYRRPIRGDPLRFVPTRRS